MSLHVVIPMAGSGQRFREAGYDTPKPFIDVNGQPMIAHVLANLACPGAHDTIIARKEDEALLKNLQRQHSFDTVLLEKPTDGAARTVLTARERIVSDEPLLIANADQLVEGGIEDFVEDCARRALDGLIMTFPEPSRDPKWSYVRLGADGLVAETKEKVALSDQATVGIYLFAKGRRFIEAATEMIAADDRTRGEFYLCPVYNYLIRNGLKIGAYPIARAAMHGLGTPEDLRAYLARARG